MSKTALLERNTSDYVAQQNSADLGYEEAPAIMHGFEGWRQIDPVDEALAQLVQQGRFEEARIIEATLRDESEDDALMLSLAATLWSDEDDE